VHERMRSEYVLRKTLDRRDILIRENHHRMKQRTFRPYGQRPVQRTLCGPREPSRFHGPGA
jgi:hypothetical protein